MNNCFRNFIFSAFLIFTTCFTFLLQAQQKQAENEKPNILFILSDDHTSQAWGIYGGLLKDYVQNKNIKRLADEGAVLDNAFCTNSICSPSRATIYQGSIVI